MNKVAMKAAVVLSGGVLALAGAGAANASPSGEIGYLNEIASQGNIIYSPDGVVARGYQICALLAHEDGNAATRDVFYNTSWTETPNYRVAAGMVNAAADNLCPWAWSRGSIDSLY